METKEKQTRAVLGTAAYYEQQAKRFVSNEKNYQFKTEADTTAQTEFGEQTSKTVKDFPFTLCILTSMWFKLSLTYYRLCGYTVAEHLPPSGAKDQWSKLYEVFGVLNRAPRQSLTNLFGQRVLMLYIISKADKQVIRVGTWEQDTFYGVQVKIS